MLKICSLTNLFIATTLLLLPGELKSRQEISPLTFYQTLKTHSFELAQVATVSNFTLKKKDVLLNFKTGRIYLAQLPADQPVAAVFLGTGLLHLQLPNEIERGQVRRFLEADSVAQPFTAAYLLFSDDTFQELKDSLSFTTAGAPGKIGKIFTNTIRSLLKEQGINLFSRITRDFESRNTGEQGLFFAALEQPQKYMNFPKYLLLMIDPQAQENIGLFQYFPHAANKEFYTVSSFTAKSGVDPALNDSTVSAAIRVTHYNLEVRLQKSGKAQMKAEMDIAATIDGPRALYFDLMKDLTIDSVQYAAGDTLEFIREKDETGFTVFFREALVAGDSIQISVFYSGKLLERFNNSNYLLKQKQFWLPRFGYLQTAVYNITYRYAENMQVFSVGEKISESFEKNEWISRWHQESPAIGVAFGFGKFDSTIFKYGDLPVRIYSTRDRRQSKRREIANDVIGSLHFFLNLLGEFPYSDLQIIETPGLISNGYPGVIFLTALSFDNSFDGVMEPLRAHELSHQWWGNLVGWQSYHDQWLSEALAEYSGAIATQFLFGNDESFFGILEGWRNDLLEKGHIGVSLGLRRFGFAAADLAQSEGLQAGPIWLGQRLGTKYPIDYYVNVYEKGAFVLHILRTMLHDFKTGDDSRFLAMLNDFARRFKGRRATTADFEKVVSENFGRDLHWFFKQWIYGTDVPTYRYDYQIIAKPNGYQTELTIEQSNVPPEFRAFIPVTLEFEDNKPAALEATTKPVTTLVEMTGLKQTFQLGPYSAKPKQLIFNDYFGVLAWVKRK